MTSWEDLGNELERLRALGPFQATWLAYVGSEDYGIWFLHPDGPGMEERRASFSLFAAHAIRKCGLLPVAVPQPLQYCPHWKTICEAEEIYARQQGKSLDFSDAVPLGLGTIDVDAVDPCTRSWLELLRRKSRAFKNRIHGTETIAGTAYATVGGRIDDVCTASAAYLKQRARDDISGQLLAEQTVGAAIQNGEPAATDFGLLAPQGMLSRRTPKELVEAAKRKEQRSFEKFAAHIGISKDTLYAITQETRWVSDANYALVAQVCKCKPEDLHPRNVPPPQRRRRQ